jgi:hypothetical protein
MNVQTEARARAHQVATSRTLDLTARVGFLGYGLVHLLLAWIAVRLAFGSAPAESDHFGAFALLARDTVGLVALVATAAGLLGLAVWQAVTAALGRTSGWRRVGSGARAGVYLALALTAGRVVLGRGESSAQNQEQASAGLLGNAAGRVLLAAVALAVVALGVGLAVHGLTGTFQRDLRTGEMTPPIRKASRWLGGFGYAGKGVAYTVVGVLIGAAVLTFDPDKARGLDAALRALAAEPYGRWLLWVVAFGFAAFGAYCVIQARYSKT